MSSGSASGSSLLTAAIVLAGGQSRRMGTDKALLQLQGEALLTRTCRTVRAVSDRALVITARPDYQLLLPQGCELLLETDPQGPLGAFAHGLEHIDGSEKDWVLLLACDLPLLTVEDLAGAIAQLVDLSPEVDAYLPPAALGHDRASPNIRSSPNITKRIDWEPLCGFYRLSCLTSLTAAINQGQRAFQHWLTTVQIAALTQWPDEHLLNCNHPEDWAQVLAIVGEAG